MSGNTAGSPGRPETKPMICPHCEAEAVRYYKDSHVRYDALEPTEDSVPLAGSTALVIGYEKGDELTCERCEKTIDLEGRDIQIVAPRFDLDLDALQRGFEAEYGVGRDFPLAALPGGDLESFGEFAERVVFKAMHEWDAISAPVACSVRLLALFPFADRLLPAVQVRDRAWQLTGAPASRDDLVTRAGVGWQRGALRRLRCSASSPSTRPTRSWVRLRPWRSLLTKGGRLGPCQIEAGGSNRPAQSATRG